MDDSNGHIPLWHDDYEQPGSKGLRAATHDERALHATLDNLSRFGPSLATGAELLIVDHITDNLSSDICQSRQGPGEGMGHFSCVATHVHRSRSFYVPSFRQH